jgi:hypothetical protein
MLIKGT